MACKYHKVSLFERDKYVRLYKDDTYGSTSPMFSWEWYNKVYEFIGLTQQRVIDFGAGTGIPAAALRRRGHSVMEIDFASANKGVVELDITDAEHMRGIHGDVGICLDVMEHIPKKRCNLALRNIARAVPRCFFSIPTCVGGGEIKNLPLHVNVKEHTYWKKELDKFFDTEISSVPVRGGECLLVKAYARTE